MAKPSLPNITTSQTFQDWLNTTNDMVNIFKSDAITASGSGDTTSGNATLTGDFTATNIIANTLLSTDDIASRSSNGTITFQSPIQIDAPNQVTATFSNSSGGQIRFSTGSFAWDIGIESANPGNFIIDTGVAPTKFELSPSGTLTVPNLVVTDTVTANTYAGASTFDDTDDVPEGSTNLYYTDARARAAFSAGSNIDISAGGEISVENVLDVAEFRATGAAGATTAAWMDARISLGQPQGQLNVTFGGANQNVMRWTPGGIEVTGEITATSNITATGDIRTAGNIVTDFSASDIALKENLEIINNALDKVQQVNGYTFNYIDKPEERLPGVVAQEIEKVLPGVVFDHERNNGTYKAVRYDNIIPLLIEAIKELKGKVNDLENRLESNGN